MARFDLYYPILIQHEGEKFVNHPNDPGGATKVGITLATLMGLNIDIDGDGDCDIDDLKKLTKQRALPVYKRAYWDPIKLDGFASQSVAEIVFDFGVNSGVQRAILMLKHLLNTRFKGNWLLNGRVTPEFVAAVNAVDQALLFALIKEFRITFYTYRATQLHPQHALIPYLRQSLAQGGMGLAPSAKALTFIKGWLARIHSFKFRN